jgi:hypothetical protein
MKKGGREKAPMAKPTEGKSDPKPAGGKVNLDMLAKLVKARRLSVTR